KKRNKRRLRHLGRSSTPTAPRKGASWPTSLIAWAIPPQSQFHVCKVRPTASLLFGSGTAETVAPFRTDSNPAATFRFAIHTQRTATGESAEHDRQSTQRQQ